MSPPPPPPPDEIDHVNGPPPLGAEARDVKHPDPGTKMKNEPADYWHGPAGEQVDYWRKRAIAAEARLERRLADMEAEKIANSRLVVIESPFAGDVDRNRAYLNALILDSLRRGEYPYASHRFFPGILDDLIPSERALGIEAGLAWAARAHKTILAMDLGISSGMKTGLAAANLAGREVIERRLEGWGEKKEEKKEEEKKEEGK